MSSEDKSIEEAKDVISGEKEINNELDELGEGVEKLGSDIKGGASTGQEEKEAKSVLDGLGNVLEQEQKDVEEEQDAIENVEEEEEELSMEEKGLANLIRGLNKNLTEFMQELERDTRRSAENPLTVKEMQEELSDLYRDVQKLNERVNITQKEFEEVHKSLKGLVEGEKDATLNLEKKEQETKVIENEEKEIVKEAKQDRSPNEVEVAEEEVEELKQEEAQEKREEQELEQENKELYGDTEGEERLVEILENQGKEIKSMRNLVDSIKNTLEELAESNYQQKGEFIENELIPMADEIRKELDNEVKKTAREVTNIEPEIPQLKQKEKKIAEEQEKLENNGPVSSSGTDLSSNAVILLGIIAAAGVILLLL